MAGLHHHVDLGREDVGCCCLVLVFVALDGVFEGHVVECLFGVAEEEGLAGEEFYGGLEFVVLVGGDFVCLGRRVEFEVIYDGEEEGDEGVGCGDEDGAVGVAVGELREDRAEGGEEDGGHHQFGEALACVSGGLHVDDFMAFEVGGEDVKC